MAYYWLLAHMKNIISSVTVLLTLLFVWSEFIKCLLRSLQDTSAHQALTSWGPGPRGSWSSISQDLVPLAVMVGPEWLHHLLNLNAVLGAKHRKSYNGGTYLGPQPAWPLPFASLSVPDYGRENLMPHLSCIQSQVTLQWRVFLQ